MFERGELHIMSERSGYLPVTVVIPDAPKRASGCLEMVGYLIGILIIFGFLMGGFLR